MSLLKVWSWYVTESIFVREAVKLLFFRRLFVKQAWGMMRFLNHFCVNMLAAWLNFVAFFVSILANLGYLIFKIFWESMPQTPQEDLGPMEKIESTFMRDDSTNPNCAPANLENMAFVSPFSSYMLLLVIIERKIEIKLLCLMSAGVFI